MSAADTGEVPVGWTWAKFGELGEWGSGGTPSKNNSDYWDGGTIPWVSAKDMKADFLGDSIDRITNAGRDAARLKLLPTGSILLVVRGMILARTFPVAVTTAPLTINQDLRSLIPSPLVEPRFILRALRFISSDIFHATGEATHGTRRLDSDTLKAWPIPLPPLSEQRRIVAAVEAVLSRVNAARDWLNRVPAILKRFRQSVLAAACSGRLTADWRKKAPPGNWLVDADLPEGWEQVSVARVATIQNGRAFPSKEYDENGIRLLRPGNLHVSGQLSWTEKNTVSLPLHWAEEFPDFVLGSGELLMNLTAQSLKDEFLGEGVLEARRRSSSPKPANLSIHPAERIRLTAIPLRVLQVATLPEVC